MRGPNLNCVEGYDLIGDIHGHADALEFLLKKLGYAQSSTGYFHPHRKVLFLGDYIDRGPKISRTIDLVRDMVDGGNANAIMGNHEFNAIAFHTLEPEDSDKSLRPRSIKNIRQHLETLNQLNDSQLRKAIEWFRSLPLWLEVTDVHGNVCRTVHACWDDQEMATIEKHQKMSDGFDRQFLINGCDPQNELCRAIENVLKGKEVCLPEGEFFLDKDGHKRTSFRSRWFAVPGATYSEYALQESLDCKMELTEELRNAARAYPKSSPPVFVGHYWLEPKTPKRLAENVACLDYSVAKGGFLCAYRWDGEQEIDDSKFIIAC